MQPITTLPAAPDASCTGLGGTVRVSSNVNPAIYPAWAAPNVFDGQTASVSTSLGWHSQLGVTSPTAGECVAVDLGSTRTVNSVTLYPASPPGYPYGFGFPVDYRIEVSNRWNFANATTVASVTSAPLPSAPVTATLTIPTLARYVRMVATRTRAISTGQYAVALAEIGGN